MSNASIKVLETYVHLINNAAIPHVLSAAIQSGVIEKLRNSQHSLEELADATGTQVDRLELLVETLKACGMIQQFGENLALAPVVQLLPDELGDLGHRFWSHFADWVKEGTTIPENQATELDEFDYLRERESGDWLQTPAAMMLAEQIEESESEKALSILDIASGSAILSMTLAYRNPHSRVTAIDTPQGLQRTKNTIASVGVEDRVKLIELDEGEIRLPDDKFDLVVLSNRAHLWTESQLAALFSQSHSIIRPGGRFVVVDVFGGMQQGNLSHRLFTLQLAFRYPGASYKGPPQLEALLLEAGFREIEFQPLESPPWIFGMVKGTA